MWGDWLYFETPDCNLVSLNAKDGKPRWSRPIADPKLEYFCTMAPLVVGNHIVAGVGGDSLDNPGYLQSLDPETGALQWQWNTEPKVGEPGSESWPDAESMGHGGGMTWMTGTYDPDLNLGLRWKNETGEFGDTFSRGRGKCRDMQVDGSGLSTVRSSSGML